jgi:hypothetical protein
VATNGTDDEIIGAARRVVAKVRVACEDWRFPSNANHAVATAGMARAADLLDEAMRLAEHPPSVGANVLVRAAYECWLVGVWTLFGGDDALLGVEKERVRNERALATANALPQHAIEYLNSQGHDIDQLVDELLGSGAPSSVKYEQMSRTLPPLIKQQTPEHEEVDMLGVYNLIYRSHSTNDAHPWKPIGQYLEPGPLGVRVQSREPWQKPAVSIAIMTMWLALLGRWIELARGRDGSQWEGVLSQLRVLLEPPT